MLKIWLVWIALAAIGAILLILTLVLSLQPFVFWLIISLVLLGLGAFGIIMLLRHVDTVGPDA